MATASSSGDTATASQSPSKQLEWSELADGLTIHEAARTEQVERVLLKDVVRLLARLQRELGPERERLLRARVERRAAYDRGELPDYLPEDELPEAHGDWQVAPLPDDILRRRVEITGPINDPKMVINMLSRTDDGHRADAAMLDFEDSMKPSWNNVMQGVENLIGAANGSLTHIKRDEQGNVVKRYELDPDDMPLLMVRVRGLHLDESNLRVDGEPIAGGLLDFVLSTFHTARTLMDRGKTPKYYVPKVESYQEARWWNRLFALVEEALSVPLGTFKATFLIETLPAAFQMEEILYELREHAAGLNVGRWDKIFSDIKVLMNHPDRVLADRGSISLNRPWMKNYALRLIKICHRRGAFAMGGMAAFTPGRTPELREEQTRKVVEDKELESSMGHDGCWVSHPYFIEHAMKPFTRTNQLDVIPEIDDRPDMLPVATGPKTMAGLRKNVRVGIGYMRGWIQDIGCVAWDNLMEDLATLEISRAQIWQWLHHGVSLDDGTEVTRDRVRRTFDEELETIEGEVREAMDGQPDAAIAKEIDWFHRACEDARAIFTEEQFRPFLTCRSEITGLDREVRRARLREGSSCG